MLVATIVCSDNDCLEEIEVTVESLDELDGLVCDCGYGCVLIAVGEVAAA